MVIMRDGKRIQLTEKELYDAYKEQEYLFDIEDIETELECRWEWNGGEEYAKLKNNKKFQKIAVTKLRDNLNNNMSYEYAIADAIEEAKSEFEQKCLC